jgi:peptidyl-prolyl cis-trans isomerase D
MTMLDRMRRHKNWLKWSLAVVVLSFILLYIPSFLDNPGATNSQDVVATVDGRDITVARFRRVYNQQMQAYRSAYGGNIDEKMLKQLGIDQRVVQQMIEEETSLAEASRLGITATDAEVQQRILSIPAFQENGRFIGDARYRQILQMQNPPMQPSEFEEQVRRGITVEKLQGALTDWITVTDTELDAEVKRRNEKVKLAAVSFPADKFREGIVASDAEIASYFDQHKDAFKMPEKRKIRFALVDMQGIRDKITISAQDVQRYYEDNQQQYSTPEQVRASHILLMTEGKNDADVKKRAEEILAKVKAPGADFAKLANEYTEEEAGKNKGGDLDYFTKGQMVPEFDQAAFSLQPGQVSDLVKTQYGYHIIKVTDKKPATHKTIDEVKAQIEDALKWERAQAEAQRTADDVATKMKKPEDLDAVAKPRGLVVSESNFFSREEPIAGIGMAPAVADRAFELKDGEVSDPIRTPQGFAFITVTGRQEAKLPTLDEVKERVREEVVKKKAVEAARQRAAALAPQMKSGDFAAAAKAAGLEVITTDLIARGAPVGALGSSPAIDAAAFSLPQAGVSDPIVTDNGAAIIKVVERKDPTAAELATARDATKTELVNERRNRFYASYMTKARDKMKININRQVIASLLT